MTTNLSQLTDDTLLAETTQAAATERRATAELLALLSEVERRGLHLGLGHSSMFAFCTRVLRMSEQAAFRRITAARAARRFPELLALLADGALSLTSVGLLAPHLTDETVEMMLEAAAHKSTRDVEGLIAVWFPQPDVPSALRALPTRTPKADESSAMLVFAGSVGTSSEIQIGPEETSVVQRPMQSAATSRTTLAPIAPSRYLLKVTIGQDTHDKLQRLRALLRHSIPDGDTEKILNKAFESLLDHVERTKWARSSKPRGDEAAVGKGRHIPAAVRREVWRRDGGQCVFIGPDGCCAETAFLEYHHVIPFAAGGPSDAANVQLRCRAHNAYEATVHFGPDAFVLRS